MDHETIKVEHSGGVGVITLHRPAVLNALSRQLLRELDAAVSELGEDPGTRVVVVTGSGERAFSAGADIHEMAGAREGVEAEPEDANRRWYPWRVAACTKPTIGAINGLAYGGGALLASSFDIRVGCERTSFKFLAATYGRVNSTWSLPMQVGWPIAKELLFTGRLVEAQEAYRIGLLNHLVASDEVMAKAMELANQVAANDPRMVQGIKELLVRGVGPSWKETYEAELEALEGKLRPQTPAEEAFKDFLGRKGRR